MFILLISNHTVFLVQFGINLHLWVFQKAKLHSPKKPYDYLTNCAILTSYIRAAPRTCRGFSRVCCHVAWSKIVRVASFHSQGREEERGLFSALLCSELMEKVSFSGLKISLISRFEWIISARACSTRKILLLLSKKTLHSGIELISEIPKQCLIITKTLFSQTFLLLLLVWWVCKSFWNASLRLTSSSFA